MSDKQYTHQGDATHLELALRRIKPWFEANATFLIYGLAVVVAVAAAIVWVRRQPDDNAGVSALWMDAQAPEDFQNIADKNEGTKLGSLARMKQADTLLNSATRKMFTDRAAANQELDQADAALNRLADAANLDELLRERVLLGQARLAEIRCDGTKESVQAAGNAWQEVLNQNMASIAKDLVERRIAELKKPHAATFYAWFNALDPQPADDLTTPGLSGSSPPAPGSAVPDVPLNFDLPILDKFGLDDPAESSNSEALPAANADSQPAGETSENIELPAGEETPGDVATVEEDPTAEVEPLATDEAISEESTDEESAESETDAGE